MLAHGTSVSPTSTTDYQPFPVTHGSIIFGYEAVCRVARLYYQPPNGLYYWRLARTNSTNKINIRAGKMLKMAHRTSRPVHTVLDRNRFTSGDIESPPRKNAKRML